MFLRIFSIFSLIIVMFSCGSRQSPPGEPPAVDVTDFIVEPKNIPVVFEFIGFAESSHPVEIRGRVEGYLDKIAYDEGQLVKEGALLFQLDPKQYQALVEQAKGEVARQEALLENAKLTVNRLKPLYEQKAASKKDLDNAVSNQLAVEASLLSAKAQLLNNQINLGYTTITSPVTGLADKSRFREGALITPGADSLLTTVSVVDPIWVYFTVSDRDVLRANQESADKAVIFPKEDDFEVEIFLSDGTVFPHKGRVNFSSPTYDQTTGSLLVRATFPNPQNELHPGQFIRVKLYGAERPNALYVPQRALMQKKGGMYVYLINKDNKVSVQDIEAGDWYEDNQIITAGLKPGDRIVVDGINKIRPGFKVNVTGHATSKSDQSVSQKEHPEK